MSDKVRLSNTKLGWPCTVCGNGTLEIDELELETSTEDSAVFVIWMSCIECGQGHSLGTDLNPEDMEEA